MNKKAKKVEDPIYSLQRGRLAKCHVKGLSPERRNLALNQFFRILTPPQRTVLRRLSSRPQLTTGLGAERWLDTLTNYGLIVRISFANKLQFTGLTEFGLEVITSACQSSHNAQTSRSVDGVGASDGMVE